MRRWRSTGQTLAEPVRLPHPLAWFALSASLLVAAFVALAVKTPTIDSALTELLRSTTVRDQVRIALAALLLVVGLLCLRRALYARLGRKPGPVEITQFSPLPTGDKSDDVSGAVLADFRRALAVMSLSAPQSVPNEPTAASVLENVKTATDNSMNVVATIAGILRAIFQVRHAYSVTAQLRQRTGPKPYGITVTVVTLPSGSGAVETIWADDWASVSDRAAHFVGAYILPRSRLSGKPPWTSWHGTEVPADLFHHAQLARRHVRARQYDQALVHFHRALKLDPQNPYLRIELAQAQEQMGLFLDAAVAYADIVAVESWYDRRLWKRLRLLRRDEEDFSGRPPPPLTRSPNGRAALLIARYRLVCRLAAGEEFVDQLLRVDETGRNTRRAAERAALRERVRTWFGPLAEQYRRHDPGFCLDELLSADGPEQRHQRLRLFVQNVAMSEAEQLIDDYRWSRLRRSPGMPVTQTGLDILRVWAPLYRDVALAALDDSSRPIPLRDWPPSPADVDRRLARYLQRKPFWMREWQEHYNAACTLAVALGGWEDSAGSADPDVRSAFARRAVRHLERGVSRADSGYVGRFAQWLATGDQDLNPLRATPEFIDFLDRYLPNEEARVQRPTKLVRLVMSLHSVNIVREYARLRASYWEGERHATADETAMKEERGLEAKVRTIVLELAQDNRDWRRRVSLIREAEDFARRRHLTVPSSALPHLQDDPLVSRHVGANGRSAGGRSVAEADQEFEAATRRRDSCWPDLAKTINDDGLEVPPDMAADSLMRYWKRVDDDLGKAVTSEQ